MAQKQEEPLPNLSSIEIVIVNPLSEHTEEVLEVTRDSNDSCSATIHSPTETTASVYSTNISTTNCEANQTTPSRNPLDMLTIFTDIVLLISALIVIISLGIVFSIVGLAIMRMYSIKGYYERDWTRWFILGVNE